MRRIWLFSANKIKSSESFSKQPTQHIVKLNSSLRHIIVTNVVFLSTDSKVVSKAGHKLFEPDLKTNFKVSNWASSCKDTKMKDKNYCKNWVGIKWDTTDSKFKYESSNEILAWGNFKYPENHIADKTHHSCKYRKSSHLNCTQKNNCHR